jgi:cyclopropane fatty-acyl-phospholipid synthase-like methyltransferase
MHVGLTTVRDFYDRWTPIMVAAAGTTLQGGLVMRSADASGAPEASAQYLAELAGVVPGDRILDAGCGVCGPAMAIARAYPDVTIEGVTISEVQARMGRELIAAAGLADRVRVHLADFHHLPFPDGWFDIVVYFESTGYSPDRFALYRETARVLRDSGTVYVKDLFRQEDPLTEAQRESMTAFDRLWACVASPTLSETERAMRQAGLVEVRTRELPLIDMAHFYESMVFRDQEGIHLNGFGAGFLRFFPELPVLFGEAIGKKGGMPGDR